MTADQKEDEVWESIKDGARELKKKGGNMFIELKIADGGVIVGARRIQGVLREETNF